MRSPPALVAQLLCLLFLGSLCLHGAESRRRWVVTEHGAIGDGATVNTRALQAAIDTCAREGGGTLVIPKGTFLSGALYFKQGVDLRLERGAILKSTTEMADFPPMYTRWEGLERYWTSAFLNFVGLKKVDVSGEGLIDGSGEEWLARHPRNRSSEIPRLDSAVAARPPAPEEVYPQPLPKTARLSFAPLPSTGAGLGKPLPSINAAGIPLPRSPLSPPRAVMFQECSGVRVSGLSLKNQARWGFVFLYCEDVVAEKLTVRAAHNIPSSDSMDIDSCRRVLITGCDFDCNDDCLSIKSGKDEDGRRVNRPSEDIVVEKTRFGYGHGGAAMGSETSGGIRNVEIRDCVAEDGNWAPIRFKSQPTRGGVVENITYRNIELRNVRRAFEFLLDWNMRIASAASARVVPTVRNIKLINIHGTADSLGVIRGLPDSPITGVTFENCHIAARSDLVLQNVRDIDRSGLGFRRVNAAKEE